MSTEMLLQAKGLCAGYGAIPVLRDIDFHVKAGEIVGVLGHNGMGKTTLMKALVGHIPCTKGECFIGGLNVIRQPAHARARRGLGYVSQGRDIFGSLTVYENLALGAAAAGRNREQAVAVALRDFPLLERLLDRKGAALSGGEQQILALARALCGSPSVLLLDEPTEGIQPSIVDEIEDYLVHQANDSGLAVVVVEQDVGFISAIASRVLWLQKGEIVKEFSPEQLRSPGMIDEFVGLEGGSY